MTEAQLRALAAGNPRVADRLKKGHYSDRLARDDASAASSEVQPPGARATVAALQDANAKQTALLYEYEAALQARDAEIARLRQQLERAGGRVERRFGDPSLA